VCIKKHPSSLFSTMLSQLKARDLAPAPSETRKQEDVAPVAKNTNVSDAEQQAAARLTCDALCSLANGITGPPKPKPSTTISTPNPAAAAIVTPTVSTIPGSIPGQPLGMHGFLYRSAVTPVVVPSQPQPVPSSGATTCSSSSSTTSSSATITAKTSTTKIKSCPKQHQLPLFLSSKYIVIPSCYIFLM
jgi:hypothetical protein